MTRKKGKFLTFIFSCIPGAGQMYMGFMKQGTSLMGAFFLIIFLGNWLNIGAIMYALPVLWFYSFFDGINKMSLDDEEFYCLEDHYLFIENLDYGTITKFVKKYNILVSIILIILGGSVLFNTFLILISRMFNVWFSDLAEFVRNFVPQTAFALFLIWLGVKLISNKKKNLEEKNDF